MTRPFKPLENKGSMRVIDLLFIEDMTTSELAQKMNIRPPSVSQQLSRLMKIRVVERSAKVGRNQYYHLNVENLSDEIQKSIHAIEVELRPKQCVLQLLYTCHSAINKSRTKHLMTVQEYLKRNMTP